MQKISYSSNGRITELKNAIKKIATDSPVFMCIGTDHVISDSLGPKIGTILKRHANNVTVYGEEGNNITASNIADAYRKIRLAHPNSTIIAIDAAVGREDQIGEVQVFKGGVLPGRAMEKDLGMVGDVGIIGIVTNKDMGDFYTLRKERQLFVNWFAKYIATAIIRAAA